MPFENVFSFLAFFTFYQKRASAWDSGHVTRMVPNPMKNSAPEGAVPVRPWPAWAAGKLVSGKPLLKLVYMPQIRTESSFLQNYQNKISRIDIFLHILPTTLSCVELDVSERRYT